MIKFISGDILRSTSQYIVAGALTGTQETPASGLAARISSKWPEAQKHLRQFARGNKFLGGDLFVVAPVKNRPGIIYIATQGGTEDNTSSFLNTGLRKLERYCAKRGIESVSMPGTDAGLGALDWETETKPLMMKYFEYGKTVFYVYEASANPDAK
ncbi:MAG: Appr-1-p processing protein [Acidobacteriota bacterium]|nr:Appr-1-p processing protein [Acidobacteriota bacterium]